MTPNKRVEEVSRKIQWETGLSLNDISTIETIITQHHQDLISEVEEKARALKLDTSPAEGYNNPDADVYNQAIDDIIKSLSK